MLASGQYTRRFLILVSPCRSAQCAGTEAKSASARARFSMPRAVRPVAGSPVRNLPAGARSCAARKLRRVNAVASKLVEDCRAGRNPLVWSSAVAPRDQCAPQWCRYLLLKRSRATKPLASPKPPQISGGIIILLIVRSQAVRNCPDL